MQISRHWRLQALRYRLEGLEDYISIPQEDSVEAEQDLKHVETTKSEPELVVAQSEPSEAFLFQQGRVSRERTG